MLQPKQFRLFNPGRAKAVAPQGEEITNPTHPFSQPSTYEGQQLDMFKPVDWVIDNAHKIDYQGPEGRSPREQWESDDHDYQEVENPSATNTTDRYSWAGVGSLRDEKLWDEESQHSGARYDSTIARGESKPIALGYPGTRPGVRANLEAPHLVDGHHRLAWTEELGHTEIPVTHRFSDYRGMGMGYSARDTTPIEPVGDPDRGERAVSQYEQRVAETSDWRLHSRQFRTRR